MNSLDDNFVNEDHENIDDFEMEYDNEYMRKKVFSTSEFSAGECLEKLLRNDLKHSTTKEALYDTFEIVYDLLPKPNYLPKNKHFLKKFIEEVLPSTETVKKHRICESCCHYLGDYNVKPQVSFCPNCKSPNVDAIFTEYMKSLLRDAFEIK